MPAFPVCPMSITPNHLPSPQHQEGRSLIELMVALTIGAIVLGSIMLTTSGSTYSGQSSNAQAQLGEEAQTALTILGQQFRMAGYSNIVRPEGSGAINKRFMGPPVRGCDNGFTNLNTAAWTGNNPLEHSAALTCANDNDGDVAFSILYEADASNSIPNALGQATDCLGRALPAVTSSIAAIEDTAPNNTVVVAENRYYLIRANANAAWTLMCAGNGINALGPFRGEPLVDNIQQMVVTYGIGAPQAVTEPTPAIIPAGAPQKYLTARGIDAEAILFAAAPAFDRWKNVVSVRVCLTVRSARQDAAEATPYLDCNGAVVRPNDRFYRRTVTETFSIRNGVGI